MADDKDDIRSRDLLVLDESKRDGKKEGESSRESLRLVQWWYKDKHDQWGHSEKLERRSFYTKENSSGNFMECTAKAKGFSMKDMELIKKNWGEIIGKMKNPPTDVPEPKKIDPVKKSETASDLEEVPF